MRQINMIDKLTPKQQRFVEEYLVDLNATQAAIRAGYSVKTAYSIGQENLTKPEILATITKSRIEQSKRTEITQDWVLKKLASIVEIPLTELCEWNASGIALRDSNDMPPEAIACIKKITERMGADGNSSLSVEQYDKLRALELIGKHLGMFTDNVNVNCDLTKLSDAEIIERAAGLLGGVAAPKPDTKNG